MQQHTQYEDVVDEVSHELYQSIEIARASHVEDCQIVVDPGIGFSKTAEQSLELVGRLEEFKHLGFPILVGLSRKSFIGHVTGQGAQNRLNGTVASCVLAYARGAKIFRVHDVKEVKEALLVSEAILHKVVVGGLTG